jgi:putative isomerase
MQFGRWFIAQAVLGLALLSVCAGQALAAAESKASAEYRESQERLARGWNTWDTHTVLSQVLLPEGLAINIRIDRGEQFGNSYLTRALIGQPEAKVTPGPHLIDGSYSELKLEYRGLLLKVQSAAEGSDLAYLVTPLEDKNHKTMLASVIFQVGMLWFRAGDVRLAPNGIKVNLPSGRKFTVSTTGKPEANGEVQCCGPYLAVQLTEAVGLSTGGKRTLAEVQAMMERGRARYDAKIKSFGANAEVADVIESVMGWNTIYEPERGRVMSPVSRSWNEGFGGYVLFDWDNFFAAWMAGLVNRDLAYANAVEMVNSATPAGFVPNFARAKGWDSYDRSEPPVGSLAVLAIYEKYQEKWLLRDTFDGLLRWNRWWAANRDIQGYLAWGSTPFDAPWSQADPTVNTVQGARFESGLDNSPMYDDAPYDSSRHVMELADVGLMALYVADCKALGKVAEELGRTAEAKELADRANKYARSLHGLWDESTGIYRNKNLRSGELDKRLSPTNFYPLLAKVASKQQAERMVREHLMNPQEFWGEFVIPATPRNEAAFRDQEYWRGRIWGPMNFLVYLGLRNYELGDTTAQVVGKSKALFSREWQANRHVHENYNAILGVGDDVKSSDAFYHWGALLVFMDALERRAY